MTAKLLFTARSNWYSRLIRLIIGSEWSHVELIVERDGQEAMVISAKASGGVVEAKLSSRVESASKAAIMTIGGITSDSAVAWARENIGAAYDWPGVLGLLFRQNIEDPKKFFCSEFIAVAFAQAGYPLFMEGIESRITPQDIWEIGGLGKSHITRETLK